MLFWSKAFATRIFYFHCGLVFCLFVFYTVSHKAINTAPQDKKKVPIPNFCSAQCGSESWVRIGSFNLQNNPAR